MSLKKILTSAAAAAVMVTGMTFTAAESAHAGTSVGPTKNGKTGVTWAYYASSDNLCIKRPVIGKGGWLESAHGKLSSSNAKRGKWKCMDMKDAGVREDKRVKIFLHNSKSTKTSTTHITI